MRKVVGAILIVSVATLIVVFWKRPSADSELKHHAVRVPILTPLVSVDAAPVILKPAVPGASTPKSPASFPAINAPLALTLEGMRREANQGNRKASCRLGVDLVRCKWHFGYAAVLQKQIEAIATLDTINPNHVELKKEIQRLEKLVAQDKNLCAGLSGDTVSDGWRYVHSAATAGDGYSAIRFAQGVSLISPTEVSPLANLDGWQMYKQHALPLLQQALDDGYPQAAVVMSRFYLYPQFGLRLVPKDTVRSVAHLMAVASVSQTNYREQLSEQIEYLLKSEKINSEDQIRAEQLAAQISSKFRSIPKEGVDMTQNLFEKNDGSECN
jgi:hypothetical protein